MQYGALLGVSACDLSWFMPPVICSALAQHAGRTRCRRRVYPRLLINSYDLPAMDDDDLRRGLPTCHVSLAKQTRFSLATLYKRWRSRFKRCRYAGSVGSRQNFDDFKLASASGIAGMCGGQALDLDRKANTYLWTRLSVFIVIKPAIDSRRRSPWCIKRRR